VTVDQLSLFGTPADEPPAPLPDQAARARIREDLGTSLLVEAGAGAGKTTEMVRRMVALVRTGTARVDQLAAVTFTRKAAAELRERFQTALEHELHEAVATGAADTANLVDAALRGIDQAFLGTIHAFCARLLRERPLDAGLDPEFRETLGAEETRLRQRFWEGWVEEQAAQDSPVIRRLREAGLAPARIVTLFETLAAQPDVAYPANPEPRPDPAPLRRRLEGVLRRAAAALPRAEPVGGWDRLQVTLRRLRFHHSVLGWDDDARFLDLVAELRPGSFAVTLARWPQPDAGQALQRELVPLFEEDGEAAALVRAWWAHRYPVVLAFAAAGAQAWEQERVRAGTLNFHDLLMSAARLLRGSPAARRELSERYRFLLVDEFQDTDPVQAEVLFLLASDDEPDLFDGTTAWLDLTPRPGALFVVGDPKQSIYRFRRADIALYQQVKRRFANFGGVVELTANFRSRPAIGAFVNDVFVDRFPAADTPEQARFAPMLVQEPRRGPAAPAEGVFWYELDDPVHGRVAQLAKQDAERLATWIAARVHGGERAPGDFLVLTGTTRWLARYATALEARGVPVQVTGAGVGGPENIELAELRLLLRALHDPGDASLTVAALVGLFFGVDFEQLVSHAETWSAVDAAPARNPFSFTGDWPDAASPVETALATLHRFWLLTRRLPADVAVAEIVDQLGILPFAAAGELGASRAGALLFVLDAIRAAALAGDASLSGALAALETALDQDEAEAPLEPGGGGAVRVMNLHKAKGLEAPVVVLAAPFSHWAPPPRSRVVRDPTGEARGYAMVEESHGAGQPLIVARPTDWSAHEAEELRFARAEEQRLLYVAATRAADELVVGCAYNSNSPSRWRSFHGWLQAHATRLELPQPARPPRPELRLTAPDIQALDHSAAAARARLAAPSFRAAPVSERKVELLAGAGPSQAAAASRTAADGTASRGPAGAAASPNPPGRGSEWGTAVHDALAWAARGTAGAELGLACRSRLVALDRPLDQTGEPVELDELVAVIEAVLAAPIWQRARAAARLLIEAPFAVTFSATDYARAFGGGRAADHAGEGEESPALEVVDGRVDLAFREDDGWVVVDYKSDAAGSGADPELLRRYRAQLALYAAAWERVAGEPVKEAILLFTATGEELPVAVNVAGVAGAA
jgi:ATP-dependent helicase/nuclease subunit A